MEALLTLITYERAPGASRTLHTLVVLDIISAVSKDLMSLGEENTLEQVKVQPPNTTGQVLVEYDCQQAENGSARVTQLSRAQREEAVMYHLCLFYVTAIKWSHYNTDDIINYMLEIGKNNSHLQQQQVLPL